MLQTNQGNKEKILKTKNEDKCTLTQRKIKKKARINPGTQS